MTCSQWSNPSNVESGKRDRWDRVLTSLVSCALTRNQNMKANSCPKSSLWQMSLSAYRIFHFISGTACKVSEVRLPNSVRKKSRPGERSTEKPEQRGQQSLHVSPNSKPNFSSPLKRNIFVLDTLCPPFFQVMERPHCRGGAKT